MNKTTVALILGLATLAVIAFAIWLFRPQPPPQVAVLNCPQLAPLASSSSAAVSEQTQKLDAALGKSLTGNGSADFASHAQEQLQQAYQAIPQPLVACQLITQASLCAIGKDPALGMKFAEMSLQVCPSTTRQTLPAQVVASIDQATVADAGALNPTGPPATATPPPPSAGTAAPTGSSAPATHAAPTRSGAGAVMARPGIDISKAVNPTLLAPVVAPVIEDCMDREPKTSPGVCTGPRTSASAGVTPAELERQNAACSKSKSSLFYGDTQASATVLYWHVCSLGKRQPFDCRCAGHKT